jgi:hypothetical protein
MAGRAARIAAQCRAASDFDGPPPAPEPREQLRDGIERYRRRVLCRPRLGQIPGFG